MGHSGGGRATAGPPAESSRGRGPLAGTLHAEWTKLRTAPSTAWLLLGAVVATVTLSAGRVASVSTSQCPAQTECQADLPVISLTGVWLGQTAVMVLAVLAVTNEYGTRMIGTTLMADPRRIRVLVAKAAVVTAAVLAAGTLGVAGSMLAGALILPGQGFTEALGYPPLSLADGPTLRAAGGTVLYLGLIGLLGVGAGMILRDTAGTLITMLALLYLFPIAVSLMGDPVWVERLQRIGPTTAGLQIQATIGLDQLPISPWAGLGVTAAYAGGALLVGGALFHHRDA